MNGKVQNHNTELGAKSIGHGVSVKIRLIRVICVL